MIKFFRKIRQNLLSEGKTGKYLKYAIGEIILVMFGILLALQVNNWNQQKQITKKEHRLLLELKNDLIGTQNELKGDISTLNELIETSDSIIQYLDTIHYEEYDKSIFGMKMGWALTNVKLYPRIIAYENLKSLGPEIISNDSIRFHITDIFDRRLHRISLWENSAVKSEVNLYNSLVPHFKSIKTVEEDWGYFLVPDKFNELSQKLYINRLGLLQNDRKLLHYLYKTLLDQITKVLVLIENEKI
ncbi:DUF6090 family protein [Thalassobellus suaedae]|uniref:DUF6090 family protein n=1 Tax=Thalassobellus suaedae TaxID=3074124 RepID=A0ABY9XSA3_9FLAO|nr:DUF6090 family protein [Flavobacteriaceae bacterium HL-DH14]